MRAPAASAPGDFLTAGPAGGADDTHRRRWLVWLCGAVALVWFVVQSYLAFAPAAVQAVQQRAVHLGFAAALGFFLLAAHSRRWPTRAVSLVLGVLAIPLQVYAFREIDAQTLLGGFYEFPDLPVAIIGLALLTVITVRVIGWSLPVLAVILVGLALVGEQLPGILSMASAQLDQLLASIYFGPEGVHGIPLDASNRYIFMFIVFGAFLSEFGASAYLIRLAGRGIARRRGGAGKMSVVASMLFGVASDSTTANVTTTGIITIPAMKRSGFSRERAAGVESAGAVGGQLMPPVMGTVAFIMVAITGIPYSEIVIAGIVPALLYYAALYIGVDRIAARHGIGPVVVTEDAGTSRATNVLDTIEFVTPVVVLIYLLVVPRWEPSEAAVWSLALLVVLHLARRRSLHAVKQCFRAAIIGAQRAVMVAIITAFVGVIIAPVLITGLGLNLASGFVSYAGSSILLILILTMLASLLLGSGLPSTATYVFLAVLMAPPLVEVGLPLLAVHMFIMYFGILSDLSPPTMATVYVASGIAESRPIRSAGYAMMFGIAGFIVPYLFVTRPEMLFLEGTLLDTGLAVASAAAILVLLITAGVGFGRHAALRPPVRIVLLAAALAGAFPQPLLAFGAPLLGLAVLLVAGRATARPVTEPVATAEVP